jgi:hypothetical protein
VEGRGREEGGKRQGRGREEAGKREKMEGPEAPHLCPRPREPSVVDSAILCLYAYAKQKGVGGKRLREEREEEK